MLTVLILLPRELMNRITAFRIMGSHFFGVKGFINRSF